MNNGVTSEAEQIQPRWLSTEQAGQYMGGITGEAVRMMLRRGRLGYIKVGRRTFIDRYEIDRFMESHKIMTPDAA